MALLVFVPDLLAVLLCLAATVTDLRSGRIPNPIPLAGILAGLLLGPVVHGFGLREPSLEAAWAGFFASVAGGLLMLVVFGLFGAINFVGMGDVKLMIAVGALLRWPQALVALLYVAFAGGITAIAYAAAKGRLAAVFKNIFAIGRGVVRPKQRPAGVELLRIPYAVAILAGTAWAVLARYLPALRVP
jgi:prepilin peptidase CpaA